LLSGDTYRIEGDRTVFYEISLDGLRWVIFVENENSLTVNCLHTTKSISTKYFLICGTKEDCSARNWWCRKTPV